MSFGQTLLLGAIAGFTIFLGLPLGRYRGADVRLKAAFMAIATGILLFLFFDVVSHGWLPVEEAAEEHEWTDLVGFGLVFGGGIIAGLMSLVYYDRWMGRHRQRSMLGPGAASAAEFERSWVGRLTAGQWLALLIATGIGVHNFAEGLAIGQSAAADEIGLALALVIGFAAHNATEGFGIVGPMAGEPEPPSWGYLGLLGVIGGAPTFVGTLIGRSWTNEWLEVAFLAVAAGSILYVVIELLGVLRRFEVKLLVAWMLLLGLFLGFGTELIIEAAGG
ncbi:MAG TPA: ZIP family metal transporter [Solirubrobacterales bacterium]|jgi:ZIP family zinc transporter|nr:ZIP family metal transporter [Solirubrobacterales bacterium]